VKREGCLPFRAARGCVSWRDGLWVAYALGVLVLSLLPSRSFRSVPALFVHEDKIAHVLLYAGLAAVLVWARSEGGRLLRGLAWRSGVVGIVAGYGVLMELLQAVCCPGDRMLSVGDMTANAAGALLAVTVLWRKWGTA